MRVGLFGATIVLCFAVAEPTRALIVWGDVHAHSGLSDDASGEPEEFFRRARDDIGLDFVVLSDHDIF
jgi:hypothetical protein